MPQARVWQTKMDVTKNDYASYPTQEEMKKKVTVKVKKKGK